MKKVYITRNDLFKGFQMILCNNITTADESFIEENYEIFSKVCDVCDGRGHKEENEDEKCDECYGEGQHDLEPYQYFIADPDEWQRERLQEYGINLGYSNKLDQWILPIYDFGTSWGAFSYSKEIDDDYTLSHDETLERKTVY